MINERELAEVCNRHGIQFAERSYGPTTTKPITLDAMVKVVNACWFAFREQKQAEAQIGTIVVCHPGTQPRGHYLIGCALPRRMNLYFKAQDNRTTWVDRTLADKFPTDEVARCMAEMFQIKLTN